jgi:hypothetical protein
MRVFYTGAKRYLVLLGVIGVSGALATLGGLGGASESSPPSVSVSIPATAKTAALDEFASEFGSIQEIYGEASATLGEWAEAEPQRAQALAESSENADEEIYAVFVLGNFTITSALTPEGRLPMHATGGRVVFNSQGDVLSISLWTGDRPASPPFGERFDN